MRPISVQEMSWRIHDEADVARASRWNENAAERSGVIKNPRSEAAVILTVTRATVHWMEGGLNPEA